MATVLVIVNQHNRAWFGRHSFHTLTLKQECAWGPEAAPDSANPSLSSQSYFVCTNKNIKINMLKISRKNKKKQ